MYFLKMLMKHQHHSHTLPCCAFKFRDVFIWVCSWGLLSPAWPSYSCLCCGGHLERCPAVAHEHCLYPRNPYSSAWQGCQPRPRSLPESAMVLNCQCLYTSSADKDTVFRHDDKLHRPFLFLSAEHQHWIVLIAASWNSNLLSCGFIFRNKHIALSQRVFSQRDSFCKYWKNLFHSLTLTRCIKLWHN